MKNFYIQTCFGVRNLSYDWIHPGRLGMFGAFGSQLDRFAYEKHFYLGVSKKRDTPKWMVKIMENPIKMDDMGGVSHYFWSATHLRYARIPTIPNQQSTVSLEKPKLKQNIPEMFYSHQSVSILLPCWKMSSGCLKEQNLMAHTSLTS